MAGSRRASLRRDPLDTEIGEVLGHRLRLVLDLRAVWLPGRWRPDLEPVQRAHHDDLPLTDACVLPEIARNEDPSLSIQLHLDGSRRHEARKLARTGVSEREGG